MNDFYNLVWFFGVAFEFVTGLFLLIVFMFFLGGILCRLFDGRLLRTFRKVEDLAIRGVI